ncbi:hypothetical protein BJM40_02115 [Listeria monocytogenes]|nr:hypothetical protein AJN15_00185 [Listeria monocytogenes]OFG04279.1 hypothetical protein BJM40_02115 [Listeria monocytogenes]
MFIVGILDKFDYIQSITRNLRGTTDINFQFSIRTVLMEYCRFKGLKYEMPNSSGGDDKCDGWIVDTHVFYQIYSPQQPKKSVSKDIQSKFENDLKGLLELVYEQGKWGGKVEEFIFLVNTFDRPLPHDSSRFFDSLVTSMKEKYKIGFRYRLVNVDYISDEILRDLEAESLEFISSKLQIKNTIDYNAVSLEAVYSVIDKISAQCHKLVFSEMSTPNYYKRISAPNKIDLNQLDIYKEKIETMILKLGLIEDIVATVNSDFDYSDKFERVISFIIEKYEDLRKEYEGIALYDKVVESIVSACDNTGSLMIPCEMLLVYVFDKCDIFEKE